MTIAAIADTHGFLPDTPPCDVLLHAGDLCYDRHGGIEARRDGGQRQRAWLLGPWLDWRKAQPATVVVATFGNHDYVGERFGPGVHVVCDEPLTIFAFDALVDVNGVRIWCTPWSARFGDWALMLNEARLAEQYAAIPDGIDVLLSHQPPMWCGDRNVSGNHCGSAALSDAIMRVQPQVVVCGHIHEGHGRFLHDPASAPTPVYNVSVVDETYSLAHDPTIFELERRR